MSFKAYTKTKETQQDLLSLGLILPYCVYILHNKMLNLKLKDFVGVSNPKGEPICQKKTKIPSHFYPS